jgi:hypothetical protein
MTFLRRKALEISRWVTWLAAPGCKEWAEGLEHEVEFIDNDWRALAWAIGSSRVLLDRREAPMDSLAEVRRAAKEYRVSFGNKFKPASCYLFWAMSTALLWFAVPYRTALLSLLGPAARAGGCLMAISLLGFGYCALVYRQKMEEPYDAYEWARYYRSELQKDLEFISGRFGTLSNTFLTLGLCLIYGSCLTPFHGIIRIVMATIYMPGILFSILQTYLMRRRLRYKIGNLDALITRGAEGLRV